MENKEIKDLLASIEQHTVSTAKRTERLELAIVGDPAMGNKGIVRRVEVVESELEKIKKSQQVVDKKMIVLGAAGTGAIFGIKGIWNKIVNLL